MSKSGKMSLENLKNLSYNNMYEFVMTKTRERNSNYLTSLGRRAKGEATPKVGQIITLYNQGKISQLQTAENLIIKLTRAKNEKDLKSAFKQYDKLIGKSETKEPLSKRLAEKKQQRKKTTYYVSGKSHLAKTTKNQQKM